MRPSAAAVALLLLTTSPALGRVPIGYGVEAGPPCQSASVRLTPAPDDDAVLVDAEVTYAAGAVGARDHVSFGREPLGAWSVTTLDGRPLTAHLIGGPTLLVELPSAGEPPRGLHIRAKVPLPSARRHGFGHAHAVLDLARWELEVAGEVTTTVDVPLGAWMPGFGCRPGPVGAECVRVTPRRLESAPLVFRPPADRPGLAFLVATLAVWVWGFARLVRRRADEVVAEAPLVPASEAPRPGGAYREPPPLAVSATPDARAPLARLRGRAVVLAASALGAAGLFTALSAERSPWPLPSVAAAFLAVTGAAAFLAAERVSAR